MALVLLYVVVDVVLQLLPPHYSIVSDAESDLAVGPYGWAMQVNFAARAVMSGCIVVAVLLTGPPSRRRSAGAVLLGVAGLCSAALVFFATDVNLPGEFGMQPRTEVGTVHVVFATTGFVTVLAALLLLTPWLGEARRSHRTVTVFLVVACSGLILLAASLVFDPRVVGIAERLCLAGILGWAFAVAACLRAAPAYAGIRIDRQRHPRFSVRKRRR
jgi:drug/metabolite transporter (DMT)-like permease